MNTIYKNFGWKVMTPTRPPLAWPVKDFHEYEQQ